MDVQRRIEVIEGSRRMPIVPKMPMLSSAPIGWDGVLLEEHAVESQDNPMRQIRTVLLHLQTGAPAQHEWRSAGKLNNTLIRTGGMHLLPPGPERSLAHRDLTKSIIVSVEPEFLNRVLQDSLPVGRLELVEKFAFEDSQIERLVKTLHGETATGAPAGRLFGQSLANALAVYLAQRYSTLPPRLGSYRGGIPGRRLKRILDYISAGLHEDLSLAVLAEIAEMNYYHFARLFKQSMGLSPHRYILEQRIERAKQFLRSPKITVLEASVRTGFADQAHFTKVFRRLVGVVPSEYRAQAGQ